MSEDGGDSKQHSGADVQSTNSGLDDQEVAELSFQTPCGRHIRFTQTPEELSRFLHQFTEEESLECNGYMLYENSPAFLKQFLDMDIRDDDVWVCSFPRSGTHWTLEMVWCILHDLDFDTAHCMPLQFRSPFIDLSALRFIDDIRQYFRDVSHSVPPLGLELVQQMESPRVIWTHMPYDLLPLKLQKQETNAKIVYVTRDIRDVCVSNYNFLCKASKYCPFDEYCDMFLKGKVMNGPYWKHVLSYRDQKRNKNLLFVEFEEMLKDLPSVISKVGQFLDKNLSMADVAKLSHHLSFDEMKNNPMINTDLSLVYEKLKQDRVIGDVLRVGTRGQWEQSMNPSIKARFREDIDRYSQLM